ncbi:aromatic ring-hydroxylating oxygenase subunit alpha [Paraburkholderia unamae]|uniref:Phenylpropionate dioxygenase-like ring-hydroxylating dioxygenase large terminal subunit n=1 Tax=Paraburkholderia unamae TaxID=219649 RepID=A0ABX5K8A7_9BURK|nr:aromatic ring-hydroxylating dioxygenase subunit alpha [Paraburkholderia unamae]PVX70769.1 phenylpropionate dioxygenase-like ring-hydroxylating dioxygenase large terminal subunit [Paraburkholderia unamae]CAG9251593.1 Ring hydroxylating dioxygenase, alpha subunit/Rieske (2Fe-2S) protein [Paraburkholderia unamae]
MSQPLHFQARTAETAYADLYRNAMLDPSLYTDPAIFEAELEKIFYKTWIWVAHESEVREPGDFKTAMIGRQPVIVVRDRTGTIRVLENRCRHRGATVCDKRQGNANGFTCPYHSWSYGLDGKLRGLPYSDGYEDVLEKGDLPLRSLRVGVYAGMIFASFNQDIGSLDDFLGNARSWIDLFMKQGAGYPIKTQGEHKFRFKGNWKIQLENTTDGYHFPVVHKSFLESVDNETSEMLSFMTDEASVTRALGNGHSVMVMVPEHVDLEADDGTEVLQARFNHVIEALSAEMPMQKVRRIVRSLHGAGFNLNLFPNVSMSMSFFRVLHPVSVSETQIRHVALGMDGGPEIANLERLRIHEHFQGPFGFGSPDDAEAWERVQAGAYTGVDAPLLVNRGLNREKVGADGVRISHSTDETGMREAYDMWKRMMEQQ